MARLVALAATMVLDVHVHDAPGSAGTTSTLTPSIENSISPGATQLDDNHSKSSATTPSPVCGWPSPQRSSTQLSQPSLVAAF